MLWGRSHIRYDHSNFVSMVHLVCPRCQGRAKATLIMKTGEPHPHICFGDFDLLEAKSWKIACESCPLRLEMPYPEKGKYYPYRVLGEFYYKIEQLGFWAYNIDHLEAIVKYLKETLEKNNPYHFIVTSYIQKVWAVKRKKLLALIQKKYQIS